jgi:hypothetical protein
MKAAAKKLPAAIAGAVLTLSFSLLPAISAAAATFPYFKVANGDVSAGGWYQSDIACIDSPNYQDFQYTGNGVADGSAGGIYSYARNSGAFNGASSDYAAYALGHIDEGASPYGFFSSAKNTGALSKLSFANFGGGVGAGGGNWGGSLRNADVHCIPDYFDNFSSGGAGALPLPSSLSGVNGYTGGDSPPTAATLLSADTQVAAGADIKVFVDGSVYIDHNITYGAHDADHIPKFSLVVKGSIYVAGSVTRLDGLYIAQPDSANFNDATHAVVNDGSGIFWSCHNSDENLAIDSAFLLANCNGGTLTVNGAVIAKQYNLERIMGDAVTNGTTAETFNYTPEMVVGGPFFTTSGGGGGTTIPNFDRIISLPPVF